MKTFAQVAFTMVCAITTASAATLINFDTLPGGGAIASGTPLTNQYASLGVTFGGFEDGNSFAPEIRSQQFISVPASSPNYLTNFRNFPSNNEEDRLDEIRILFASGVSNVSMIINTAGTNNLTFEIYDTNNSLLSTEIRSGSDVDNVSITLPGSGIGRISVFQPADGWWYSIDNLQFDMAGAPIPEPSTYALVAAGVAAMLYRRRRKA